MRKLTPTPLAPRRRMTARTFCNLIVSTVEDEPKRLYMDDWVAAFKSKNVYLEMEGVTTPACGTVCCLAGWGNMLAFGKPVTGSFEMLDFIVGEESPHTEWGERLETTKADRMRDELNECFHSFPAGDPGTERYVRLALKPFKKFVAKHDAYLRNRIIDLRRGRRKKRAYNRGEVKA